MISKNKLKELAAYRLQKRCDEEAVFIVEGPKMCAEVLASGIEVLTLCATAAWLRSQSDPPRANEVLEVSDSELDRLSLMRAPNQVWLLAKRQLDHRIDTESSPLILALDRLQDPGNLGTIMRTADWYGIRRIVCSTDTVSSYNPKAVQASMGAVLRTRMEYTDLASWLAESRLPVYAASLQGEPLPTVELPHSQAILVIGNESQGISPRVMATVSHPVLIPNRGKTAESLNAAIAAGILMNHFATNLWNN